MGYSYIQQVRVNFLENWLCMNLGVFTAKVSEVIANVYGYMCCESQHKGWVDFF